MLRWFGKHLFRMGLMGVVLLPVVALAAWLMASVPPDMAYLYLSKFWVFGTLVRAIGYYVGIDIFFARRAQKNLLDYRNRARDLQLDLAKLQHQDAEHPDIATVEDDLDYANACVVSVETALNNKRYLWGMALTLELMFQLLFFTAF